jgi:hypothetical protein
VNPVNDTNVIVNRLVHEAEEEARGHDAVHLITGFGLNPISAARAGATFPETAVDLQEQQRLPAAQRNLNGILIENINDGVWEAMREKVNVDAIVSSLPPDLRLYGRKVMNDLDDRTGYGVTQPGIAPGTDFDRQSGELTGMGLRVTDNDDPSKKEYIPNEDTVEVHHRNFGLVLDAYPDVKRELTENLRAYVTYAAQVEKAMNETGKPPKLPPLELTVSSETTEILMRTASVGLGQLQNRYPNAQALPELRNYYDSVRKFGDYGTPEVSKLPESPAVA